MHIMKSYYLYCLLTASLCISFSVVRADTVSILSDRWYPVSSSPTSSQPGYMVEIAEAILTRHGHTLDYRLAPWKRSIAEVREGNTDCIIGAYKSDAPDFIFPAMPWGKVVFKFYTRIDSPWKYQDLEQLEKLSIGVVLGYSYSTELDKHIKENKHLMNVQVTTGGDALKQNILKLVAKRIDVVVAFEPAMIKQLAMLDFSDEIKYAGELGFEQFMYIACSPKKTRSHRYVRMFSEGIIELRKSGELKKILDQYNVEDWHVESQ